MLLMNSSLQKENLYKANEDFQTWINRCEMRMNTLRDALAK